MSATLRRRYERGQRCDTVNDARVEDFPANSKWATLAASVKEHLAAFATLDVERASSKGKRRQGTAGRGKAYAALEKLVDATARTAEAMLPEHPDIKGMFERPTKDRSARTLVATGRSYADRVAPIVGLFVELAMPPTLVTDLRSAADTLESYISMQNEGVGAGVNANAAVREHLRALDEKLKALNVIYHNHYRNNPSVLAEWESAYHLEAAPGSRRRTTKPNGDGTPPPPDGTGG